LELQKFYLQIDSIKAYLVQKIVFFRIGSSRYWF